MGPISIPKPFSENSGKNLEIYVGPNLCLFLDFFRNFDFKKCGQNQLFRIQNGHPSTKTNLVDGCSFSGQKCSHFKPKYVPLKESDFQFRYNFRKIQKKMGVPTLVYF